MKIFPKINLRIIIAFSLTIILAPHAYLKASDIKIRQVIYNNYVANWGMSKYNRNMTYTKLDKEGLPIDLVILFRLKAISFKFTSNDSSVLIFKNRLIGSDSNWTFCENNRVSTFKIPKPGKYTYQVQGLRQNKIVHEKLFQFEISPKNNESFVLDLFILLFCSLLFYFTIKMK